MPIDGLLLLLLFFALLIIRIPVAFALLLASIFFFVIDDRLVAWTVCQRLFFGVDSFVLLAIPLFILTANLMNEAQVTARLIALALATVGWIRGGLGMVNVGVGMLMAGVSGSSTADTAAVGGVLIKQMVDRGYDKGFTVAVTAASSVIGTIIPPSIQMIVWGSLTNTSVAAMFLGGVIPGILVGLGQMAIVYVVARRDNYPTEKELSLPQFGHALAGASLALGVPVVVIGGIVLGVVTATEAAVVAVLYSLFLGLFVYRTLKFRDLPRIFRETAELSCLTLFALAAASVFGYLLSYFKVPILLNSVMGGLPSYLILPFIVFCWLVIGTFLDALPAMVLLIPVFAPLVTSLGLDPVFYGVVSVMTLATGLITPPYGLCLMLSAAIAKVPMTVGIRAIPVFIVEIVAVIALCMVFPQLVMWVPNLLLGH